MVRIEGWKVGMLEGGDGRAPTTLTLAISIIPTFQPSNLLFIIRSPTYTPHFVRYPFLRPDDQPHPSATSPQRAEPWRARPDRTVVLQSAVFQFPPQLP